MIGVVRGDEDGLAGDRLGHGRRGQAAFAIHRHTRGGEPVLLEPDDGLLDGGMFDV